MTSFAQLESDIRSCSLCADNFASTHTRHAPRPVVWFRPEARILIAGQAPGARVHESGRPFTDASGDRLREWLGLDEATFYDKSRIAIVPMAFCFPGYNAAGSDLPPPPVCRNTWLSHVMASLPNIKLSVVIGGYAHKWHLGTRASVSTTVRDWEAYLPDKLPLPHPSWRNTGWLKKNPWFQEDVLPRVRSRVAEILDAD